MLASPATATTTTASRIDAIHDNVATKADLEALQRATKADLEALRLALEHQITRMTREGVCRECRAGKAA